MSSSVRHPNGGCQSIGLDMRRAPVNDAILCRPSGGSGSDGKFCDIWKRTMDMWQTACKYALLLKSKQKMPQWNLTADVCVWQKNSCTFQTTYVLLAIVLRPPWNISAKRHQMTTRVLWHISCHTGCNFLCQWCGTYVLSHEWLSLALCRC